MGPLRIPRARQRVLPVAPRPPHRGYPRARDDEERGRPSAGEGWNGESGTPAAELLENEASAREKAGKWRKRKKVIWAGPIRPVAWADTAAPQSHMSPR